jgi:hypothetical protein
MNKQEREQQERVGRLIRRTNAEMLEQFGPGEKIKSLDEIYPDPYQRQIDELEFEIDELRAKRGGGPILAADSKRLGELRKKADELKARQRAEKAAKERERRRFLAESSFGTEADFESHWKKNRLSIIADSRRRMLEEAARSPLYRSL